MVDPLYPSRNNRKERTYNNILYNSRKQISYHSRSCQQLFPLLLPPKTTTKMIGPMILVGLCGLLAPQFVGALREFGQLRSDVINHELHLAPTTLKAGLFDDTFLQGVEDKLEAMKAEYDTQREDHPTGDFSLPGVDNPLSAEDAENFERKLQDAEKQDQTILKEALAWHKKLREEFEAIQSAKNCQETESVHVAAEQTVAQRYPNHDNMMTLAKEPQRFSWPCWNWKKSLFGQFLKGMPELVLMLYAGEWGAKGRIVGVFVIYSWGRNTGSEGGEIPGGEGGVSSRGGGQIVLTTYYRSYLLSSPVRTK